MQSSGFLLATSEVDVCIHCTVCPWKWIHWDIGGAPAPADVHGPFDFLSSSSSPQLQVSSSLWALSAHFHSLQKLLYTTCGYWETEAYAVTLSVLQNAIPPFLFCHGPGHSKKAPSPSWASSYPFLKGEAGIRLELLFQHSCFYPAVLLQSRSCSLSLSLHPLLASLTQAELLFPPSVAGNHLQLYITMSPTARFIAGSACDPPRSCY